MVDDWISIRRGSPMAAAPYVIIAILLDRNQIDRRGLAAPIDLELELDAVAFVERDHAGALHRRDVNERIGLAIVAGDEAEALGRVEELHRAGSLLAGQLALRAATAAGGAVARRAAILNRERIALDLEVGRRAPAAAIDEREIERLAFGKAGQPGLLDRADVDEHVLAAIVPNDEAESLLAVEEFHDALGFADDLGGHAAAGAAAAETAAAATATAAAITAATAAAAESIT